MKDRQSWITGALDSIWNQTYRPVEVIVVDNESSDTSVKRSREWTEAHTSADFNVIISSEKKPGASAARNHGLHLSKGEYIYFMDSDDRMNPELITEAINALNGVPDAGLISWRRCIRGGPHNGHVNHLPGKHPLESQIVHCCLSTQSMMIRRATIDKSGGWNEHLPVWNDLEFGLRILLTNPRVISIDRILCDTFWHSDSLTGIGFSNRIGQWEKSLEAMRSLLARHSMQTLIPIIDYRYAVLAGHYLKEGLKEPASTILAGVTYGKSRRHKLLLRLVMWYVAHGGRGSWLWARYLTLDSSSSPAASD